MMKDRVRVYELARQMNISNEEIITGLRELGYDIKSHSSTVEKTAVGLLITKLNKSKGEATAAAEKAKTAPKAPGAKQSTKATPPPPPVVKPRVLGRYRPVASTTGGEPTLEAVTSAPPAAPQPPVQPAVPSQPEAPAQPAVAAQAPAAPPVEEAGVKKAAPEVKEEDFTPPVQEAAPPSMEEKPAKGPAPEPKKPEAEVEVADKKEDGEKPGASALGQLVRPMTPSVPVRIAAPSPRATVPRPPKSRHQAPSDRHSNKDREKSRPAAAAVVEVPKVIALTSALTVKDLAERMGVADTEVITRLFKRGIPRTVNQIVELDLARELAAEMEYEVLSEALPDLESLEPEVELTAEEQLALVTRPPVVTIMGHVDHGKTSLLDAIRQTKFLLTDSEAGGITQHIGAYHVEVPHEDGTLRQIVFLDTPGHEAFTAMRARGAKATDVAILVVAADDGVMPQTIEAIDHAKAAGVPIIVAVNKVDKADADPDRVLTQLMEHDILPDKFGGETVTVNVSAKKRTGLDELLEMILLVSEMLDLKANPDKSASGVIIEAEKSARKGSVVTALVENGTLREGDLIVAGTASGRVRALSDDRGHNVKAAGPSMPVEILGLDEVPRAGDRFEVVADIQASKQLVEQHKAHFAKSGHVTLESLHDMLKTGEVKDLNVIVKADVHGTAEAIADQVKKLSGLEVQVRVLRAATGDISENDVNLAASSNAIIIGFNVQPDQNARQVAEVQGVDVRTYSIIYQIIDDLEKAIQGLIQPLRQEVQIGTAEIRQIFKFGKNLMIAGCMVTSGKITRGAIARIEREGQIIYDGKIETLKRFKDDAREVASGFECGMSFEKFNTVQEGDKVVAFVIQETKRELTR
ncbi:MAG TPA: translation initiation factor IF-2 [Planktothrix sp.]|jgi:translation initiation factor IF-2